MSFLYSLLTAEGNYFLVFHCFCILANHLKGSRWNLVKKTTSSLRVASKENILNGLVRSRIGFSCEVLN